MTEFSYGFLCVIAVAGWLAVYRLPFGDPARRRRVALWLADRSNLRPDVAFTIFATCLYLILGIMVLLILMPFAHFSFGRFLASPSVTVALALVLAIIGTSSLNVLLVSFLYRAKPTVDVPGEISRIQWISSLLVLHRHFRWIVPAAAAVVEEVVFRGVIFLGLLSLGRNFWLASIASTLLFALGQLALVSTPIQGFVIGTASVTLGTIGTLLIAATGSIVPAVILHMSFAGFYTNMSTASSRRGARRLQGLSL